MSFACPLRVAPFAPPLNTFADTESVNEAVAAYRAAATPQDQNCQAQSLYLHLLPLVKKTLARFCVVSGCAPGACYPQDLVGDSYLVFLAALDAYDPAYGLDFLGYLAMRLHRGLRHRVEAARRVRAREITDEPLTAAQPGTSEEASLLDRLFVEEILRRLSAEDESLLQLHHAEGYHARELAERLGSSDAAIRKRLERARLRARHSLTNGTTGTEEE